MAKELAKQSEGVITFEKQPELFLRSLYGLLHAMQQVYRSPMEGAEMRIWEQTLKIYSIQEIEAAQIELLRNPPKQELEDGTVQVWRGMPKLPDFLYQLEKKRQQIREQERQLETIEEMRQLNARRAAGERFYGEQDLAVLLREKRGLGVPE